MSQMVLPQTQAPGGQPDTGSKKAPAGHEKSGDSQFDSVSRAEQRRMDRKQADRREQAERREDARNSPDNRKEAPVDARSRADGARGKRTEDGAESRSSGTVREAAASGESVAPADGLGEKPADVEIPEELATLTFANLQAMLEPARGTSGMAGAATPLPGKATGQAPLMQGLAGMIAGLPGMPGGKPGETAGAGQGMSAGFQLTEALTALTPDAGRTQDNTTLLAAGRLQTLADVPGQQLANAAARLPADATGLKGYATSVDVPVGHAEWGDKMVGKLTWLTANKLSVAEIHLTPPDMGPMEVRVQVQQEQANITVHAANPAVRDQLELHSHRLRDMLSEQGLSLEQFDVADSPQRQANGQDADGDSDNAEGRAGDELAGVSPEEAEAHVNALDLTWKGEVDIFA
ncbi:flagellar hook-length control protein FliK [Marinobacter sp. GN3S48]|uniref:flagellar hook-length control protein FliK n=1 Tax=Marinobacter sp. GN3S48 TaxID=3382302 RepID=UPI00387B76D0